MKKQDLHEYQRFCVQFILNHPIAALLLDCGLGKTVTTLTAIEELIYDRFEISKVLVICPLRVGRVWVDEVKKWDHLSHLKVSMAIGSAAERKAALERDADIYIINRENLTWLEMQGWGPADMIVVDELSSFKSWQSKRFKTLMRMRPLAKRAVGLTGTPVSNGLMDLFAEFKVLDMGKRLGRFITQYRNHFFLPDRTNGHVVFSYKPKPGAEEEIYRRIGDVTVSMRAIDHLQMPELISTEYPVYMDGEEQEVYDELKKEFVTSLLDGEVTAANAGVLSGKLCQMANGAVYTDEGEVKYLHDRKLEGLEDILESAGGQPLLIGYWFQHDRERIEGLLKAKHISFVRMDKEASIAQWNRRAVPVALIHPASAGHGLNLQQGGSCLVWFGLTWSLELYQQTVARLWRQGQKETVRVLHIVTAGTIDEDVLDALEAKDGTQKRLIEAVKAEIGGKQ